jgi:hypothetical protein
MQDTIDYLNEVDNAWRTVLRGNAWVVDPSQPESGKAVRVDYAGTVGQTERLVPLILSKQEGLIVASDYGRLS